MITKTNHIHFDAYEVTADVKGPRVLVLAGVHGDESEPMLAALSLLDKVPALLKKGSVTIVPVSNPSAFTLGRRCGSDHLDLARSFPGEETGSATIRLAHALQHLIRTADFLIDLHTGGALLDIFPLCGYMLHSSKTVLAKQREMAHAFGLPLVWGTEAQAQGRSLSVARDLNIPAIYAECRGGATVNQHTVALYENGCIQVLTSLGLTGLPKETTTSRYWLEDHTCGGGHLQSKFPAPAAGIFSPQVTVGDKIKKGQVFGQIINPLTNACTRVRAPQNGLVFMLRIQAKVNAGDSLGGILPVSDHRKRTIYER